MRAERPRSATTTTTRRVAPPPPRVPRRWLRWLTRLALLSVIGLTVMTAIVAVYVARTTIPAERLQQQSTLITDADAHLLGQLYDGENRTTVRLSGIPKVLQDAVLAAEDRNFYRHRGVDPFGIARALWADVRHRASGSSRLEGGSTITQQYVKNAFLGRERSVQRKMREAALALKLERRYTKAQILEKYLNAIYFGRGAYGVQAASRTYFGLDVSAVTLPQAAYLDALIRGPVSGDAQRHPAVARARRDGVLSAMVETGAITPSQRANAVRTEVAASVRPRRNGPGAAYLQTDAAQQYIVDRVRSELVGRFGAEAVFRGGLQVRTTIDARLQRLAYASVYPQTLNLRTDPDGALVALDEDGDIVALVGGRDWTVSKVNLAVRGSGSAGRPAGSTFKPFVLATVLREGFSLRSQVGAPAKLSIPGAGKSGQAWIVNNFNGHSAGRVDLVEATARSFNTVFAQIVTNRRIGPVKVAETAKLLGVAAPLHAWNAIALGAENVAPLDLATAYLTLARRGVRTDASLVAEVRDRHGRLLYRRRHQSVRALSKADADAVTAALVSVVAKGGTGAAASLGANAPVAGKTGTTQDNRDAWFVGYTPRHCCAVAVWVGYRDGAKAMTAVHGGPVSGGTLPASIFRRFMSGALEGLDVGKFATPAEDNRPLLS